MPYGDPDPRDPNVLVGVSIPADREAVRELAYAYAEEFAALGYGQERLLALFREPFYRGPHRAYRELGEVEIRSIVAESVGRWGRVLTVVRAPADAGRPGPTLVQIGGGRGRDQASRSEEAD